MNPLGDVNQFGMQVPQMQQIPPQKKLVDEILKRLEVVNVYILKPKTDPKQRNPLPTIKDVTILDPGKRENSVTLRSFKNIVFEYTFQKIYADNRKRIQSRRDAEIVRIKKAMLKIYLEEIAAAGKGTGDSSLNSLGSTTMSNKVTDMERKILFPKQSRMNVPIQQPHVQMHRQMPAQAMYNQQQVQYAQMVAAQQQNFPPPPHMALTPLQMQQMQQFQMQQMRQMSQLYPQPPALGAPATATTTAMPMYPPPATHPQYLQVPQQSGGAPQPHHYYMPSPTYTNSDSPMNNVLLGTIPPPPLPLHMQQQQFSMQQQKFALPQQKLQNLTTPIEPSANLVKNSTPKIEDNNINNNNNNNNDNDNDNDNDNSNSNNNSNSTNIDTNTNNPSNNNNNNNNNNINNNNNNNNNTSDTLKNNIPEHSLHSQPRSKQTLPAATVVTTEFGDSSINRVYNSGNNSDSEQNAKAVLAAGQGRGKEQEQEQGQEQGQGNPKRRRVDSVESPRPQFVDTGFKEACTAANGDSESGNDSSPLLSEAAMIFGLKKT